MTVYAQPGAEGSVVSYKPRYDNWIGGEYVAPVKGEYFENPSPVNGKVFCEVARGTAEDIELALDAAHAAAPAWGKTSVTERANILNRIADRIEANLDTLAFIETIDNGKPIRETTHAHPVYELHGVLHYGVGNVPAAVPHTSTYALTNVTLRYAVALADKGWQQACRDDSALALGLNTHAGQLTNAPVAQAHGLEATPLASVL